MSFAFISMTYIITSDKKLFNYKYDGLLSIFNDMIYHFLFQAYHYKLITTSTSSSGEAYADILIKNLDDVREMLKILDLGPPEVKC